MIIRKIILFLYAILAFALFIFFIKGLKELQQNSLEKLKGWPEIVPLTHFIFLSYSVIQFLISPFNKTHFQFFPIFGTCFFAIGTILVITGSTILGENGTTNIKVNKNHKIISSGPFKLIRHPMYLGAVLLWLGISLLTKNILIATLASIISFLFFLRATLEEKLLIKYFGDEYLAYLASTPFLVPWPKVTNRLKHLPIEKRSTFRRKVARFSITPPFPCKFSLKDGNPNILFNGHISDISHEGIRLKTSIGALPTKTLLIHLPQFRNEPLIGEIKWSITDVKSIDWIFGILISDKILMSKLESLKYSFFLNERRKRRNSLIYGVKPYAKDK